MILSIRYRVAIACCTKTGTGTLEAAFAPIPGFIILRPKHGCDVPEGAEDYTRYMVARNPYDRLVSIYHGCRRLYGGWRHDEVINLTFPEFLIWFAGHLGKGKVNVWNRDQLWFAEQFKPYHVGSLERLPLFFGRIRNEIKKRDGVTIDYHYRNRKMRRNEGENRIHRNWKRYYHVGDFTRALPLVERDCLQFKYHIQQERNPKSE